MQISLRSTAFLEVSCHGLLCCDTV